ncbi:hypothetical protein BH23ACT6_BH23ACT6_26160 [soil metagenome]
MNENPADTGSDRDPPPAGDPVSGGTRTEASGAADASSGNTQQTQPPPRSGVFGNLHGMDVRRTPDRWLGGVAAGLAHRMGLDPLVIRAGFIVLGLFFGLGVALYLVAWALIPDANESTHLERGLRAGRLSSILLLIVAVIAVLGTVPWWDGGVGGSLGGALFGLIVIAGLGYALYRVWSSRPTPGVVGDYGYRAGYAPDLARRGAAAPPTSSGYAPSGGYAPPPPPGDRTAYSSTPPSPPPPPAPRRARRLSGGGALAALAAGALLVIVGGMVWSADAINLAGNPITVAWCAGLVMLGAVLLGLGLAGRRAGFVGFFAVIAAFAVLVTAPLPSGLRWSGEAGEIDWVPTASTLQPQYEWGVGNPRLDLRELTGNTVPLDELDVDLGLGELVIYVPENLNVVVNSDIGAGAVSLRRELPDGAGYELFDDQDFWPQNERRQRDSEGLNVDTRTVVGEGPADLQVNAEVGVGQVTIISTEGQ